MPHLYPQSLPQKERRRRVRFSLQLSESIVLSDDDDSSYISTTRDIRKGLWYQRQEILLFKKQARDLFLQHASRSLKESDDLVLPRGLECCYMERRVYRHKTIQCILGAVRKGMSSDEVAKVSRMCSVWNEGIALIQACKDYCSVYKPSMRSLIPKLSNNPPEFPFALKRSISSRAGEDGSDNINKRSRLRRCLS